MLNFARRWLPLALVALAALWLRTHDLGARPMHADEANQAVKFGALLERGEYRFDPGDHHGPTLYYATLIPAWARGERTLAELTETTVRLTPAIFGVLGVLLVYFLGRPLGEWTALTAAAFAALSAPAVYFSRFFIQETLLVTFTFGALACGQRWWRSGRVGWALGAGACVGLMLATKESAVVFVFAAVVGLGVVRPPVANRAALLRQGGWAALVAVVVAAILYSSFLTNPAGPRDALAAIARGFTRATGGDTGHEKPWWYYVTVFTFNRGDGFRWDEYFFLGLAVGGGGIAFWSRSRLLRFIAVYSAVLAVILSITPYKTPWIVVNLVPGLAVLAAGFLVTLVRLRAAGVVFAALLGVATLYALWLQTELAVFKGPTHRLNPLAYVHSTYEVKRVPAMAQRAGEGTIKVIGEEYWPLPWYLRAAPKVGYWSTPPADCDAALIFATSTQAEAVRARLHGHYRENFLGLREGVLLVVFKREP